MECAQSIGNVFFYGRDQIIKNITLNCAVLLKGNSLKKRNNLLLNILFFRSYNCHDLQFCYITGFFFRY